MAISPALQRLLEIRGITCSNDPEFAKVVPWFRFTFVLCSTAMGIGTALAFTPFLWAMVPIAALGAVFPRHPFDLIYNHPSMIYQLVLGDRAAVRATVFWWQQAESL